MKMGRTTLFLVHATVAQHQQLVSAGQVRAHSAGRVLLSNDAKYVYRSLDQIYSRQGAAGARRTQVELDALMDKMEVQAAALATRAESAHELRCDVDTVGEAACGNQNYHSCGTKLPNPVCGASENPAMCGLLCGTVRDFTVSTVHVTGVATRDQPNLSPLRKESICWTRLLDETFLANYAANDADDVSFPNDSDLPTSYFGDEATGLFRDFPGGWDSSTWRSGCGSYDPRVRPWYTTAMSPPKDVVILLDASGSMSVGASPPSLPRPSGRRST
jgi:hypothetical protein